MIAALAAGALQAQETPCKDDDEVAKMPARYTDHTKPKYPFGWGPYSGQEKALMMKRLIEIEKLEEKSRANFQATGCFLRTSFNGRSVDSYGGTQVSVYGYQLAAYMNVCHIQQHVVKTVDEYRTVLRVDVNPFITAASFYGEGDDDFYITDPHVRYTISIKGSRISKWFSEDFGNGSRSDFEKINNGHGWTENVMMGSDPKKYQWLDRYWYITKSGLPLFIPVTRKEYLDALLEFYEMEKKSFQLLAKNDADRAAYQKIYENKVANVKAILAGHDGSWLGRQAVVDNRYLRDRDYRKPANGLLDFKGFSSDEAAGRWLVQYNPQYFVPGKTPAAKPLYIRVEFRYEMGRYFSEELFKNFEKNFDFGALHKMLE